MMETKSNLPLQTQMPVRLLFVENNRSDVDLCLHEINRAGIPAIAEVVERRAEFIERARSNCFDLILVDYRLDGWWGTDALKIVKDLGIDIPCIMVTGRLGEENAVECIKRGAVDFVLKDHLARLPLAIRTALNQKESREQRLQAERALRDSEASFQLLFADNPLPMWVYDLETLRFLQVNEAAIAHYGYTREEFLRMRVTDIRPQEDVPRLLEGCEHEPPELSAGLSWRHRLKDGRITEVEISSHRLEFGGRSAQLVVAQDVTERRALEKQLQQAQKFEAVGQLAGGVAHDFNNMIGAILGWVELGLEEAPRDGRIRSFFERIRQQAERAAALTRQLLAFARRQMIEPRSMDLNQSVTEVLSLLEKVLGSDIAIESSLAPNLPAVRADPTQIEQVLMNLCLNARDAMPEGGRLVIETQGAEFDEEFCRHHTYARPGRFAMLAISDTGIGMDAATLDRIFEPFFTTKETGKGTGLGLATVYGVVKQHSGFVQAYSEPGHGTTFRIYFPASQAAIETSPLKEMEHAVPRGQETILIAEDHEGLREIARETLTQLGYQLVMAADGEEAVEKFRAQRDQIDLVLLDVVLPKLSGPEAYKRMQELQPHLPAIFTTGYSADTAMLKSVREKGFPILQKPYMPRNLARTVRETLDHKRRPSVA